VKNRVNLVTGGTGFLGSHLIEHLINNEEKVICIDNNITGKISNISHLLNTNKLEFINHDVKEPISLEVDKIWHLACPASPQHYQIDPIETAKTCFIGTLNMLNLAKESNAKILIASTSEVYGDPKISPQSENYFGNVNPNGIRSCYDEGKRIAETLAFDFHRKHNVEIKVVRIFNTYGPRMNPNDGRVISNFIVQAMLNKPITIYGRGEQTRSFCYVDDLIEGILKVMQNSYIGPINLGNPKEITIRNLAENIKKLINPSVELTYKDLPEDDPFQRKPDLSLAERLINWNPKIDINDGILRTKKWFENEMLH